MNILTVYKASNGDIFFKHDANLVENNRKPILSKKEDIQKAKLNALEMLESGNYSTCKFEQNDSSSSYHTENGVFIGHGGLHITNEFSTIQDYIYIERSSDKNNLEEVSDTVLMNAKRFL